MRIKTYFVAALLFLVFGFARQPFEDRTVSMLRERHLILEGIGTDVRSEVGQMGYAVALGGFRSLVATVLNLEATVAWSEVSWDRLHRLYQNITRLQPRNLSYWLLAHWHLGYNAFAYYRDTPGAEASERRRKMNLALDKSEEYLHEGMKYLPEAYQLPERLAHLELHKREDKEEAAKWFGYAADLPDAPTYVRRFQGYCLADVPGREQEAYDFLCRLYREGIVHRKDTMITKLRQLETHLNVLEEQSILKEIPPPPRRSRHPNQAQ